MSQSRRPSLAKQWFVEDGLASLAGLCPLCRAAFLAELEVFAPTPAEALAEVYTLSCSIRAAHFERGDLIAARAADDWEAIRFHRTLRGMVVLASEQYARAA